MRNGGAWEYLLPDALGSVRQIVDANGNVTLAKSYEPYGTVLTSTGTASSIFAYAGEQIDTTGLIYLRARYLNPRLGIFLARDPWSGEVMRPGSMNGFNYGLGNPISQVDPSGRDPYGDVQLLNPGTSPDRTDDQTLLKSTIRFTMAVLNDPCDLTYPPSGIPENRDVDEATGTYMGNNHIYTHHHGSFRTMSLTGKTFGISKIRMWNGQYIYGGKNSPVDKLSVISVLSSKSSGENTDIELPDYLDKMFKMYGIPPAQRGDPNELKPFMSIVSVPVWNEGAERYEVFHANWLKDTSMEAGVPSGFLGVWTIGHIRLQK